MATTSDDIIGENFGESVQITDDIGDAEAQSAISKKRKTSEVWNHFSLDKASDGKSTVKCNHCGQVYSYEGSKYGTSTLSRHLEKCKKKPRLNDLSSMFLDHEGKMRVRGKSITQKACREWITKISIAHDLPLNWIEYKTVRGFLKYLNPDIQFVCRNTVSSDVKKMYESEKEKLKLALKKISGMICLTSDVWTACTNVGYICLTAHYVDENWKLNSKLLSFCAMPPPHSGPELAQKIHDCLVDWEIDRKVFSLTLDNASANNSMVRILKSRLLLQSSLLCNGDYFHIRCSAHILNLIVQEGLKVASVALDKIRASVKYVKGSEARMNKFHDCARKVGVQITSSLSLDVPTRWNSTYLMLASAIRYRSVFGMLSFEDLTFKHCPSDEEWERGERMSVFLRPFYKITNLISGSSYPTSNLYFMEVWKIQCFLEKNSQSSDNVVREMSLNMKEKFDKYWEQYSEILAMGAVFDPRVKLSAVEYCYSKLDASTSIEKVENLKMKMHLLYDEYKKRGVASSSGAPSSQMGENVLGAGAADISEEEKGLDFGLFDFNDYNSYKKRGASGDMKSPLDKYLEEDQSNEKQDINVLEFWRDKESSFGPELVRMACDVLSIPITTVTSESSFSIGAHILTKYRNRLLPEKVQALICTRNWLHGYDFDDDEDNEDDTKEKSGADSNLL